MKKISACRVCNSKKIEEFLDLGEQPYANSLLKKPQDIEKLLSLSLSYCHKCSLVQLNHTADPLDLFTNYLWVTATSSTARKHAKLFYRNIISRIKKSKKEYILEVGSNDGTFLLPFIKSGYTVLGVDPAQNIVDMAIAAGVPTQCDFFGEKTAKKVIKKHGKAGVVFARNVLPHVANTHDFVEGLSTCLNDDGILAVEFHYAKKIYQGLHYDSIYHEHLCYFTLKTFEELLNRHGFFIEDLTTSPISGGSLVVFARKKKVRESATVHKYKRAEEKIKLNEFKSWQKFAYKVRKHKEELIDILNKHKGKVIVGYGSSARSSTLLNYCEIGPKQVSVIADQNPLKQGLYTAGTHILIQDPKIVMEKRPDFVVILAWNFMNEITKFLKEKHKYKGKYIIPLPNDPKII